MIALDTDVLSEVLARKPAYLGRLAAIDPTDRAIPVVVMEEVLRGRLNGIRLAHARRVRLTPDRAYDLFQEALDDTRGYRILPYTLAADTLFRQWRAARIRVGAQDLRIAAICVDHRAKLVTRNARDSNQVPGLNLEVWN